MSSRTLQTGLLALSLLGAIPAGASDGRVGINRAAALAGGVTAGDAPGFPVTLSEPGSYLVTGALTVPTGTPGIVISGDDVHLDLAGFTVVGPASCTATSCLQSSVHGVAVSDPTVAGTVVENGSVRGFGGHCIALGTSARVERARVSSCGRDGIDADAGSQVLDSAVDSVGSDGIVLKQPGLYAGNVVTGVSLAAAGFVAIAGGGGATRGNVCHDGSCSRHARRRYYLSNSTHAGSAVLTACLPGYHMASILEILDTSALEYDTTAGDLNADSGSGPVSNNSGWVRTGGSSNTTTNCSTWTSNLATHDGTVASLQSSVAGMNGAATHASPWSVFSGTAACGNAINVWCVED